MPGDINLLPDLDYGVLGRELNIPGLDGVSPQEEASSAVEELSGDDVEQQLELLDYLREKRKGKGESQTHEEIIREYNENPVALISEHESRSLLKVAKILKAQGQARESISVQNLWAESAIGTQLPNDIETEALPIEMAVNENHFKCEKFADTCVITRNRKVVYAATRNLSLSDIAQLYTNMIAKGE